MGKYIDLTGQKFNRLTVEQYAGYRITKSGNRHVQWLCKCDCGNNKIVTSKDLKRNAVKSCGCLKKETCLKMREIAMNNRKKNISKSNTNNVNKNNNNFNSAYIKFEAYLNKQDKNIEIKSAMLCGALVFASQMDFIDQDYMKKIYGEFMFSQMNL